MYDDEADEVEYISQEIERDNRYFKIGDIEITDYWDEESINMISKMYDIGES
tara:strand:+ start:140 stop:295 length:156 start_codon:yes stop_codon:yes gene_type:complete